MAKHIIDKVIEKSIGEELGIEKGDKLVSLNGKEIEDIIDYFFMITDEYIELEIEKSDGEIWMFEIDKDFDEDLGLEFYNPILDKARSCKNKCIFCFIDQLPENMRETLYFKDDDSRLSFLQGNFITLTNLSQDDLDRIVRYNISPINVSIHTTNPDLRVKMLGNRFAGNVLEVLTHLTDNRIMINGQIVLCPNVNDGEELERTIRELSGLYPNIHSVAAVPIGITKFRQGLFETGTYDKKSAREVIAIVEKWQEKLLKEIGSRFIYLSDEFYIIAELPFPSEEEYDDYIQIENGVGLIPKLLSDVQSSLEYYVPIEGLEEKTISFATGTSAYEFIKKIGEMIMEKEPRLKVNVFKINNDFFGETITVSGLITGRDLISQLKDNELGDTLYITKAMLKADEDIFLDDYTLEQVIEALEVNIVPLESEGEEFILGILNSQGGKNE
ncbi:MAG: DUF512 domain-containing protein [Firmicutes bacterium]|jgi:putative radical SAM enzyme (TIGR03279 family)|nr:DUF512 domain-containing protein [Bacillota bacterium]